MHEGIGKGNNNKCNPSSNSNNSIHWCVCCAISILQQKTNASPEGSGIPVVWWWWSRSTTGGDQSIHLVIQLIATSKESLIPADHMRTRHV